MRSCTTRHRTYRTLAKCIWGRRVEWVDGDGPHALLAWCDVLTITLWQDLADAVAAKRGIDRLACGHACRRDHQIVRLDLEAHRYRRSPA